jgi:hypothetical protein
MKRLLLFLLLLTSAVPTTANETREIISETKNSLLITEKDVLTDSIEYRLAILTKNSQPNSIGSQETSQLLIYCDEYGVNAYLPTNTYNGQKNQNLKLRWNKDSPVVSNRWGIDTSTGTSFGYKDAKAFLEKLGKKDRLLIMRETHSGISRYFIFDLIAARKSILKHRSLCSGY